ncbi:MAG TPA: NAD(P)(+) transhydrogenase (Re/Si-specific) subunit beta [Spirochaetota bacterium]|nr:NAD(P)(+) transhydrogenase (Re/Si-specific) subunit beta [Spirochaetota bacterium]
MTFGIYEITGIAVILAMLAGIRLMSSVGRAALGNRLGALSMLAAIALVLWHNGIVDASTLYIAMAVGAIVGAIMAFRVTMIRMPQMVALLNGLGGGASLLVALSVILESHDAMELSARLTGQLALIIGSLTLSGSMVAAGKLQGVLPQRPVRFHGAGAVSVVLLATLGALAAYATVADGHTAAIASLVVLALALGFGVHFTLPIGGADMPVAISLLNSYSGLAASICGFAVGDILLVSVGAVVGAAGLILTRIMCRAMNRSLIDVLTGSAARAGGFAPASPAADTAPAARQTARGMDPASILASASSVIIIPGYGMALAQAQSQVRALYDLLESRGATVRFAIHPVAGRMPGHMNVLLAEVDIPYERLIDMETINPEFAGTDAALIVGACDVVNPAANSAEGTPIDGMPVLRAEDARSIIICNMDRKPGYSGVENTLYGRPGVCFMEGNAADTLNRLIERISGWAGGTANR